MMMVAILNVFPAEWELAFRRRWEVAFPGADPYLVHLASLRRQRGGFEMVML